MARIFFGLRTPDTQNSDFTAPLLDISVSKPEKVGNWLWKGWLPAIKYIPLFPFPHRQETVCLYQETSWSPPTSFCTSHPAICCTYDSCAGQQPAGQWHGMDVCMLISNEQQHKCLVAVIPTISLQLPWLPQVGDSGVQPCIGHTRYFQKKGQSFVIIIRLSHYWLLASLLLDFRISFKTSHDNRPILIHILY